MAAPSFIKRVSRLIAGEVASGLLARDLPVLPTGHIARVRLGFGVIENAQDYTSGGDAYLNQSEWIAIRNNTGSASSHGAVFSVTDDTILGAGTWTVQILLLPATGVLSFFVDPSTTDLSAVVGRVVADYYSWPNTVTS